MRVRWLYSFIFYCFPVITYADFVEKHSPLGSLSLGLRLQTASFSESNNWFGKPVESIGERAEYWWEGSVEPHLRAELNLAEKSTLYGELSYLYAKNFGVDTSGLSTNYPDAERGLIEQAYIGWRSGNLYPSLGYNAIDLSIGRQDYNLGSGFLLYDGANDGGKWAGWWLGVRQSFTNTVIARLDYSPIKLEIFHLDTRTFNRSDLLGFIGGNLEYNIANSALLSLSYIYVDDAPTETIEGLNVFDVRLQITPIPSISGLTLEGEFAQELKGSVYDAQGGYAQIKYHWDSLPGSPELSYRYSALAGDNPSTPENEQFHSLAYGFSDWGTWFQGEITGEHVLDHSNLISHLYRIQVQAHENVWVNFFYYHFRLDQPEALQNDITNAHFADEFNLITDWSMNDNTQVSASFSVVIPAEGAKSYAASGNQTWIQGMLYLTFDF